MVLIKICWNLVFLFFPLMEARMTEVKHEIRFFFFFPFQNEIHLKFCFHKPLQILFVQLSGPVYST